MDYICNTVVDIVLAVATFSFSWPGGTCPSTRMLLTSLLYLQTDVHRYSKQAKHASSITVDSKYLSLQTYCIIFMYCKNDVEKGIRKCL